MPPRPSSVRISNSPSVAFCKRAATAPQGDVSPNGPTAVNEAVGVATAGLARGVSARGAIGLPQLPQNRSPERTAPPQLGHVDVIVGVIAEGPARVRPMPNRCNLVPRPRLSVAARPVAGSQLVLTALLAA